MSAKPQEDEKEGALSKGVCQLLETSATRVSCLDGDRLFPWMLDGTEDATRELTKKVVRTRGRAGGERFAPWSNVTREERESFKAASGQDLDDTVKAAFGTEGVLAIDDDAQRALLALIKWDLRHLFHPSVIKALRHAQQVGDRPFLKAVGHALWQNQRYAPRGMRKQRRLTRILFFLADGDLHAYQDGKHREKVYRELKQIYHEARVSSVDPGWMPLSSPEYFTVHLRRIGLLPDA
jgi:hypothetical protein